jgi:hypothetical protein
MLLLFLDSFKEGIGGMRKSFLMGFYSILLGDYFGT